MPTTFADNLVLEGAASIVNLKPKSLNCTPQQNGSSFDSLPSDPVLGQIFHSLIDDRFYRWGFDRNNPPSGKAWYPIADQISGLAFDELGSPPRMNVAASEGSVRQAFEDVSAIGAVVLDMNFFRTLTLDAAVTPYEIQVVIQQGYSQAHPQLQPYVVNNPFAPRVIRVKNPENQNPNLFNDTIPVITGDVLLPSYNSSNGSYTYKVVRAVNNGILLTDELKIKNNPNPIIKDESNGDVYASVRVIQNKSNTWTDGLYIGYHNSNFSPTRIYGGGNSSHVLVGGDRVVTFGINNIVVGDEAQITSALVQFASTTKGFLCPRMTTAQINAIASPAEGLQVYNTTLHTMCFYNGSSWQKLTSSAM